MAISTCFRHCIRAGIAGLGLAVLLGTAPLQAEDLPKDRIAGLRQALADDDRDEARRLLTQMRAFRGPVALAELTRALATEDEVARRLAYQQMAGHEPAMLIPALPALLGHRIDHVRAAGVRLAVTAQGIQALKLLARIGKDDSALVRRTLASSLGRIAYPGDQERSGKALLNSLANLLRDDDPAVRIVATESFAPWAGTSPAARKALMLAAQDEVEEMAWIAAKQLGAAADTGIDKQLAKMAKARQPHQRIAAAIILGERLTAGSTEALDALLKLGKDRDWTVQTAVSDALGIAAPKDEASTAAIEELLIPRLGSDDWAIRNSAGWALARLGSSAAVPAMIKGLKLDDPNIAALQGMLRLGALETPSAWKNWLAQQGDAAIQAHRWGEIKDRTSVEFYEINEETGRVCYIIDTSGSMAKAGRLGSASRELWRSTKDLAIGTHVNIITFADRVTVWQPVPLRATWRSKGMIKRYLATLGPRGSTNTSGALGLCLDLWGIETAFLLTDGMPTVGIKEPKGIIEHISYRNHLREEPVRLHTIAFHLPAGAAFLKELAQRNKGTSRLIQ